MFDSSTGTCSFYAGGCRTGSARRGRVLSLVAPTSRHLPHALHPDILPSPYYMVPAKAVGGPSVVTAAYGGGHRLVPDPVKIASEFNHGTFAKIRSNYRVSFAHRLPLLPRDAALPGRNRT